MFKPLKPLRSTEVNIVKLILQTVNYLRNSAWKFGRKVQNHCDNDAFCTGRFFNAAPCTHDSETRTRLIILPLAVICVIILPFQNLAIQQEFRWYPSLGSRSSTTLACSRARAFLSFCNVSQKRTIKDTQNVRCLIALQPVAKPWEDLWVQIPFIFTGIPWFVWNQ